MTYIESMRKITIAIDNSLDMLEKYTLGVLDLQLIINTLLTIVDSAQEKDNYKLSKLTKQVTLTIRSFNEAHQLSNSTIINLSLIILPK